MNEQHKIGIYMNQEKTFVRFTAFGVAAGTLIGVLTDNLGLWISLGVAIGAGLGIALNEKNKNSADD
jgi:uncharacterized membrane protein